MRKRIQVLGTVQGVGFRPFVYRLAKRLSVNGFVRNTVDGVIIEAEGTDLGPFLDELRRSAPALARVDNFIITDLKYGQESGFTIRESAPGLGEFALVPPDVATCDECLRDVTEPGNRRHGYPFTNCTNCGPRYTIIQDAPYDRATTTMAGFAMCPACQSEYDDPADRRFHAQPNACPVCGPRLSAPVEEIVRWLAEGRIVAIKGLGGFHLACDARNDVAVRRLRERKRRSEKPFAIMVADLAAAERICEVDDAARELLTSARRPIVLMRRRAGCGVSDAVAPGGNLLGVMLPYTPLHHLLFAADSVYVMTSGNWSEEPIVSREEELPRLAPLADAFVMHNRPIATRVDDSVARTFRGRPLLMRRSRGYAPAPLDLGRELASVVACGGELKNTFCLTKGRYAILSQHIGDLENYETLVFFRETLEHMKRFFRVEPEAVAHDLHPDYLSTQIAREMDLPRYGVQHHHAHVASCMAEHNFDGPVIGVAFDGTGYGLDGKIWGGELMVADYVSFERRYHLRYVPLAGGDQAVREPWRAAAAYLHDAGLDLTPLAAVPEARRSAVARMMARGVNTVETSSCGRLFDAVAALVGVRLEANYEAQAAMELEALAIDVEGSYDFEISGGEIDFRPMVRQIVAAGQCAAEVSGRFHATVARAICEAVERICATDGLRRVCLSGGSFQNTRLLETTVCGLESRGFEVFTHSEVPPNDGGLALGQAMIANALIGRR